MSSGVRGPYAKTAAVRHRILESALAVFADSGYRATTMKAVAERAGLSQRGLVHHFATKEDLLTGVLADYDDDIAERMPQLDGLPAILAVIEVAERDTSNPAIIELHAILSTEASAPDHPAHVHYQQRYARFRTFLIEQFEVIRARGDLRTGMDSATLARLFVAALAGLQSQWLYDRDTDVGGSLRELLVELVSTDSVGKPPE